jgi:hypothetical protein
VCPHDLALSDTPQRADLHFLAYRRPHAPINCGTRAPRSNGGGPRSKASSSSASPTPGPRATTASSSRSSALPAGSGTRRTTKGASCCTAPPAGPRERQWSRSSTGTPLKCEEPPNAYAPSSSLHRFSPPRRFVAGQKLKLYRPGAKMIGGPREEPRSLCRAQDLDAVARPRSAGQQILRRSHGAGTSCMYEAAQRPLGLTSRTGSHLRLCRQVEAPRLPTKQ